jgi:hypothetical protein
MKKLLLGLLALIDALIGLQVLVAIDAVKSEDALWLSGAIIGRESALSGSRSVSGTSTGVLGTS